MYTSLISLALLAATAAGSLQVLHPKGLKRQIGRDGVIQAGLGNFGHVVYGSSIMGRLYYPVSNTDGCRDFKNEDLAPEFFQDEKSDLLPVVLVDRGTCSFVTKVKNMEKLGIHLALIADNQEEQSENLIMTNDGSGHEVKIPSFIIRKKDADIIKKHLRSPNSGSVYIKAELEIAHPDNRVEYEFWYSSILDIEYDTLVDLALYQQVLSKNALFAPRVVSYSCGACSKVVKEEQCIGDGEYCPYIPQQLPPQLRDIKGRALITESLRQRCLYETLAQSQQVNHNFTQWFNYVLRFIDDCTEIHKFNKDCSMAVMNTLGIDSIKVEQCVNDAIPESRRYGQKATVVKYLEDDRQQARKLGVIMHPFVTINNVTYRGEIDGKDVFHAICAGFKDQPAVCKSQLDPTQLKDNAGELQFHRRSLIKVYHIIAAIILVLLVNAIALMVYRKYQKKKLNEELHLQVNSAVSQYFKLSGQE